MKIYRDCKKLLEDLQNKIINDNEVVKLDERPTSLRPRRISLFKQIKEQKR